MLTLVTGNPKKLAELNALFGGLPISVADIDIPEIQSMELAEIVAHKVRAAFERIGSPVMVDDVSFEIEAFNGFPGPLVKWWAKHAGYEPAVIVAEKTGKWGAVAIAAAAYADADGIVIEYGRVPGRLSPRTGEMGFGFDFYFVPEGETRTFSEMGQEAKMRIGHRGRAFRALAVRLAEQGKWPGPLPA